MKIMVKCDCCGKDFLKENSRVNEASKNAWKNYCSERCHVKFKSKDHKSICATCGKSIMVKNCDLKKSKSGLSFCSRSCAASHNNVGKKLSEESKKKISNSICNFHLNKNSQKKKVLCLYCGKEFFIQNKEYRLFCSKECSLVQKNGSLPYTREEVLTELLRFINENKNQISSKIVPKKLYHSINKFFGSWNSIIEELGLVQNSGMPCKKKILCHDGHYADSISEMLVDNWLNRMGLLHERSKKYPKSKCNCDFYLVDSCVWVEYCGLMGFDGYRNNMKNKRIIAENNDLKLIEILPDDLYPNNLLVKLGYLIK